MNTENTHPDAEKWVCTSCGFIYDPQKNPPAPGIAQGTPFRELPDDWKCPICYVGKETFDPL